MTLDFVLLGDDVDQNGIEATFDSSACQLKIFQLLPNNFGDWSCKVVHSGSSKFQVVHFALPTPGQRRSNHRLPGHLKPEKYTVYLTPFIEEGNFSIAGHVDISIDVKEAGTNNITLHINNITIFENLVKVVSSHGAGLEISGFGYDAAKQFFIIYLKENFPAGDTIKLSIVFLGDLGSAATGFYRSSYFDSEKNKEEYLATTQFEARGARKAFPCFDEPALKAIFKVNLGRLRDMNSISNMPHQSVGVPMSDNDIFVWDVYQETPIMPTYLLAFIVSRYTYIQGKTSALGTEFKVWSRKSINDKTTFIADIAPKILEFYENLFNISYPLPKMDLAGVQNIGHKGMDNWGLITLKEPLMIFDPEKSSLDDKEQILHLVSHELAHQWFGNLVTLNWWTE